MAVDPFITEVVLNLVSTVAFQAAIEDSVKLASQGSIVTTFVIVVVASATASAVSYRLLPTFFVAVDAAAAECSGAAACTTAMGIATVGELAVAGVVQVLTARSDLAGRLGLRIWRSWSILVCGCVGGGFCFLRTSTK